MNYLTDTNGKLLINNGKALKAPELCQKSAYIAFNIPTVNKNVRFGSSNDWVGPVNNKVYLYMIGYVSFLYYVGCHIEFKPIAVKHGTADEDPIKYFTEHDNPNRVPGRAEIKSSIYNHSVVATGYLSLDSPGMYYDILYGISLLDPNGNILKRGVHVYRSPYLPGEPQTDISTQSMSIQPLINQKSDINISETAINFDDLIRD